MPLNSMLGAITRPGIAALVLEEPRLDDVSVRPCQDGLLVDVRLAVLGLVQLGSVRATARFSAVLERHGSDGRIVRRDVASIESCDASFRRQGLGLARASLLLDIPGAQRFWPRIGAPADQGAALVDLVWTDLIVVARRHRLTTKIRGEWRHATAA